METDTSIWFEIIERFGEQTDLLWAVGVSLIAANVFILSGIIRKQARDPKDCIVALILGVSIFCHAASAVCGYMSRATSISVLECIGHIETSRCTEYSQVDDYTKSRRIYCNNKKLTQEYAKMERTASLQLSTGVDLELTSSTTYN